jgi:hypothetical protein
VPDITTTDDGSKIINSFTIYGYLEGNIKAVVKKSFNLVEAVPGEAGEAGD